MKIKKVIVFDLDDTLYYEIDFLKSAYKEIAQTVSQESGINAERIFQDMLNGFFEEKNVFKELLSSYKVSCSIQDFLKIYRNHKPKLQLTKDRLNLLNKIKDRQIPLGLLTDGRSIQQRSKIEALGISHYFNEIVISEEFGSEKPNELNYKHFESVFGEAQFYYIGDNVKKDFVSANTLNWITIRLIDQGHNINKNDASMYDQSYQAKYNINNFSEIENLLNL